MITKRVSLYVVDHANEPVAVMEAGEIHRQELLHRRVYLLARIDSTRLVLRKRPASDVAYPGRWDLFGNGHVPADFSALEAAEHFLPEPLCEAELPLVELQPFTPASGSDNEFITVFQFRIPPRLARHIEEDLLFMSVDRDELQSLISTYPELLTPAVITAWHSKLAFGIS